MVLDRLKNNYKTYKILKLYSMLLLKFVISLTEQNGKTIRKRSFPLFLHRFYVFFAYIFSLCSNLTKSKNNKGLYKEI